MSDDSHIIILTPEAFAKFIEICENPPPPTQELIDLFKKYGSFAKDTQRADAMSDDMKLLPCPFCGGPAGFEECQQTMSCTWSVGCQNGDEDCIAYQMLAHFNRKSEAAEAWNKRPAADEIERLTAELKEATEIIKLQLRGYRTSKDSVRAFAFVDKHSES